MGWLQITKAGCICTWLEKGSADSLEVVPYRQGIEVGFLSWQSSGSGNRNCAVFCIHRSEIHIQGLLYCSVSSAVSEMAQSMAVKGEHCRFSV